MDKKFIFLSIALIVIILLSALITFQPPISESTATPSPFYVGIEFGYGNVSDCKALVDKVCNYTNLLVISTPAITENEALLNETCNYAYAHNMHIIIYFTQYAGTSGTPHYVWSMKARDTYGPYFLGAYIYDEVGGEVLDLASGAVSVTRNTLNGSSVTVLDYKTAATNFIINANAQANSYFYCAKKSGTSVMTADYGLYWFDYKAGYDTVLAEFGWGNNRELVIAQCRGAATAQGKDWGAIICWEEAVRDMTGVMENGTALYNDLTLAYDNGAKYAVIFDYAGKNSSSNQDLPNPYTYGILTDEHFDALQKFWTYIQQNPQRHGIIQADTALVLPQNFGFGFRSATDRVWGINQVDPWATEIWDDTNQLLTQHNYTLDIVYSDPEFKATIDSTYSQVITWDSGAKDGNYSVINLNSTFGYNTIQSAITSGMTSSGDVLFIKAGTHNENVQVTKSVTLLGEDKSTTVIDGGNFGSTVQIIASNVVVKDLTIINGNPPQFQVINNTLLISQLLARFGLDISLINTLDANTLAALVQSITGQTLVSANSDFSSGIYLMNSNSCRLENNVITNCMYGVILSNSENTSMRGNTLTGNSYGFGVIASSDNQYMQDIDASNTVNGKPICYWVNKTGQVVPADAAYVALVNCTDMTIQNMDFSNNYNGLLLADCQNIQVKNNVFSNNYEGLTMFNCTNTSFQGNIFSGNTLALGETTIVAGMDETNIVNGKPICVWVDQHDRTVPSDAGIVMLINCSGITVQDLILSESGTGVLLQNSNNCTITGNTLADLSYGVKLFAASNNTIIGNTFRSNQNGIVVANNSANNNIAQNSFTNNTVALSISNSSRNTIQTNVFSNNTYGLQYPLTSGNSIYGIPQNEQSSYNLVIENDFTANKYGIALLTAAAADNTFYHNNFVANQNHTYVVSLSVATLNTWDNGQEGNYWSDYNGTDANGDGVGDQLYYVFHQYQQIMTGSDGSPTVIYYGDEDLYPLMQPYIPNGP